jgi:hypothetical protein
MRASSDRATVAAGALALTLVLGGARSANAGSAPRTSSLSWVRLPGADSCVSTQDLARDVEARLRRTVFVSASSADVSVEGRIEPKPPGGWHATISVRDDKGALLGTRNLESPAASCAEMREELAFVIAVMIDPDAALAPKPAPVPLPAPAPAPAPVPAPAPAPAPVPAPAPPERSRWRLDTGTSVSGSLGLLPEVSFGARVDALLTPPRFIPLEGYGIVWPHDAPVASSNGPTYWLVLLGGGLCPLTLLGERLLLYACGSGIVGLLSATAPTSAKPAGQTPVLAAELEGRVSLRLGGPFVARAGLAFIVPILREDSGTTADPYKISVVAGTVDAGLGLFF